MDRMGPLVIVGGGLAGALAALALAERRPDLPLLLVEAEPRLGGNHVWSFFDGDLDAAGHALVAPLRPTRWPSHSVAFPRRRRTLGFGYNSITSDALDAHARDRLGERVRLGAAVAKLASDGVTLADGTKIPARGVIDARGPSGPMPGLDLAWQKFVGIEFAAPGHGLEAPVIMDAAVEQVDGYRFVYSLPFAADRMFVEDTYYSDSPRLDMAEIRERIHAYAKEHGWDGPAVREEVGVLPVLLGGDPDEFWPAGDAVARLGVAGGFFHPMTGYSLPLAVENALALAGRDDFSGAALARWSRERFLRHWRRGGFFRGLARMLFRAGSPDLRYRVFEHFYRLPEGVIARFYAGRLTPGDRLRILTGKPPVPLIPAMKALLT
jgi:lycopene beta-cyclase